MRICMFCVYIYIWLYLAIENSVTLRMYVHMHIYMHHYACMHICMYICIYLSPSHTHACMPWQEAEDMRAASHAPISLHAPIAVPKVTALEINYRTHNGILKMAGGVIDLLQEFFAGSFDNLPREKGYFDGPLPTCLLETSLEEATVMIVGSDRKQSQIE